MWHALKIVINVKKLVIVIHVIFIQFLMMIIHNVRLVPNGIQTV